MAKVGKPNRRKGTPPPLEDASQNTTKTGTKDLVALNFKVPADFKKEYKLYALEHNISMVQLLEMSFEHYKRVQ